jgi:cytochrome bd-type quinol oxidase subunit 2
VADRRVAPARDPGRGAVLGGVAIVVTMAVLGGLIIAAGSDEPEHAAAGAWPALAIACLIATPGVFALLGLRGRPWLLTAAGFVLFPMCFLSFSVLFLPLVVPAVIFLTVAIVRPRKRPRPWAQCLAAVLSLVFVVAALVSLFAHEDPVEWHTATESGSASDVITMQEALTSLGFVVAAITVAALAPRDGALVSRRARCPDPE